MKTSSINSEKQKSYEAKKMIKNYAVLGTSISLVGAVLFFGITGGLAYALIYWSGSAIGFLAGIWYACILSLLIMQTVELKQSIEKKLQTNIIEHLKWQQDADKLASQVTQDSEKESTQGK